MIVGKVVGSIVSTRKSEKLMNLFPISFSLFRVETILPTTLPTII